MEPLLFILIPIAIALVAGLGYMAWLAEKKRREALMALAAQLRGNDARQHIAVIGDASIASGMAFEALNHAGVTNANLLVILNDNAIGIDPSVGALKEYLTSVKKGGGKSENLFECLNFRYSGPMDGHDLPGLIRELNRHKSLTGPRLLHLITTKGKGLQKAEENQVTYHAPGSTYDHGPDWWYNLHYPVEAHRGAGDGEDAP